MTPEQEQEKLAAERRANDAIMQEEANQFAMHLLVPTAFLLKDADANKIDMADDRALEKLAKKYRVPMAVMAMRINQVFGKRR